MPFLDNMQTLAILDGKDLASPKIIQEEGEEKNGSPGTCQNKGFGL